MISHSKITGVVNENRKLVQIIFIDINGYLEIPVYEISRMECTFKDTKEKPRSQFIVFQWYHRTIKQTEIHTAYIKLSNTKQRSGEAQCENLRKCVI